MPTKLKCFLTAPQHSNGVSVTLFLLRVIMGIAFMHHGWGKIQNPFAWMPAEAPVPAVLQFLAALAEFGGGIALIVGLLTRIASFGLACTMAVATLMHAVMMKDPFVATGPGQSSFELPFIYLAISLLLMTTGPGKYSIDAKVFKSQAKILYVKQNKILQRDHRQLQYDPL